jgi:probable rRNA maturation factor
MARICVKTGFPVSSEDMSALSVPQPTMILFDSDQTEAAQGFPSLAVAGANGALKSPVPTRPTLMRYLREAQAAVGLKGEVAVLLTTDEGIRGLNKRFRKKNKATDVLSFPAEPGFGMAGDLAGDLAISMDTAARQAAEQGHKLSVELRVLMLHGLLHLSGMDHEIDDGKMARKERRLRAKLGLPMGLIERVESPSGAKTPVRKAASMYGLKSVPFVERKSVKNSSAVKTGGAR